MASDDDSSVAKGATLYNKGDTKRKRKKKRKSFDKEYFEARRPKDEHNLKDIIRLVEKRGTKINFYKKKYLIRRTRSRINRTSATSYREYYDILKSDRKELAKLMDALSINVTRFFRNNESWNKIESVVLPEIIERKEQKGKKTIKIWSAGCAVGAEPYSLSILVDKHKYRKYNFKIFASDINQDLLSIAQNGVYDEAYLDEMNRSTIYDAFDLIRKNTYAVKPRIKKRVTFSRLDLTKDRFPSNLDLIVCRNVMIYMKRDAQDVIKDKFIKSLNPRGFLVLGRTETLSGKWRGDFENVSVRHRIYRKLPLSGLKK